MPLLLKREKYPYFDISNFENTECLVDAEYYLPDYCPDIQKILKCTADVQIISYSVSDSKLTVQGNLNIIVMYTDEKCEIIRNCEITKEFTTGAKLNLNAESMLTYLNALTGHIICRAVSARKLDIHIPVIINYAFCMQRESEIVFDAINCEKQEAYISTSKAFRVYNKDSSVSQNIELMSSMKPIESIIRKNVEFLNVRAIPVDDGVEVSADIEVTVIYRSYSENSLIEKLKYQIPFSEKIELTGCSSEMYVKCNFIKGELSLIPKEDSMGENNIIALYTKFGINLIIYTKENLKYVKDVCSLDYVSKEKYEKHIFKSYDEKETKLTLSSDIVTESLEKVIDVWCDEAEVISFTEQNKINYRGKFTVNVLYYNKNKKVAYASKTVDFNSTYDTEHSKQERALSFVKVNSVDYKINCENLLKINFDINVSSFIELLNPVTILTSSEAGEELSLNKGSINIIYTKNDLWQIAKSHKVPVSDILEINGAEREEDIKFPIILYRK